MLLPISNVPRDYAWGSLDAIATLEGRAPSGAPEAEVWFGDHPGNPSVLDDAEGMTLDAWIGSEGAAAGVSAPLPYLMKLLAAASPLSIQAHPSIEQARAGFAGEESAGIPRDAAARNYRDANHKPEVIVALSDTFEALAGFRPFSDIRDLVAGLGDDASALAARLDPADPPASLRDAVGWLLSGDAPTGGLIDGIRSAAAREAQSGGRFAADLQAVARIADAYPGDPGVVVALLLNRLVLDRGEAAFVPAGVPHAYLQGLGVEIMAASDNVLRGGLTPKHVDVVELLHVLDATPAAPVLLTPEQQAPGVDLFAPPVSDFALVRVRLRDEEAAVVLSGPAIALATAGEIRLHGAASAVKLVPGAACFVTPEETPLRVSGTGELFVAEPGVPS